MSVSSAMLARAFYLRTTERVVSAGEAYAIHMANTLTISLTKTAYGHLEALRIFDRNRVLDAIKEQLTHHPDEETRNKKLLRGNPVADWELRVQPFRVFCEVDTARNTVRVVAVGQKKHNTLIIGGEEIEI